eukprot:2015758-Amphidinium_carterae.1
MLACITCGAYSQLRNAGMSKQCQPTASKTAQLKRIRSHRHPQRGRLNAAFQIVELAEWHEAEVNEAEWIERPIQHKHAWLV